MAMKLKIVSLIVSIGALVFLLIPSGSIWKSVSLKKHGVSTESTVISVSHHGKGLPDVTVTFKTTDNSEVTANATKRQVVSRGDIVKIWYDPASPQKIDFGDTISYNIRGIAAAGFIFIIGFYYFVKYSLTDIKNKNLVSSGMKIAAEFISVDKNEKYRMGDNNPWVISCRWTDSRDSHEYFFVSKDYTIDPVPFLNGRTHVDIFVDPADPGKYYMDTTFMPIGNNTIG
jgi:hypothetical protein